LRVCAWATRRGLGATGRVKGTSGVIWDAVSDEEVA